MDAGLPHQGSPPSGALLSSNNFGLHTSGHSMAEAHPSREEGACVAYA